MNALELVKKENLLQLVIDHIPSYIFWKDRESNYLGCNMKFAKSAGLNNPNEIIGKNDYDLSWSKEDSDFYRATDAKIMSSGEKQLNFEEPQTINNGKVRWLRTSKIPLYDADNNVIGILGAYEDITAKKEMELKLIEQAKSLKQVNSDLESSNFKLEEANIDLEQFAYATSHDLQEPLRMIGSFAGLLEKRYADQIDEQGKEYIKFVTEGVERMSHLIRGVLSYSKLDKEEEASQNINLNLLVKNKLKDLTNYIEKSGAKIDVKLPEENILCQPLRIGIVFYNLILNGIKFNESNTPTVSINFEEQANKWLFTVKDNGIGVDDSFKEKIFKPFKRLNSRENYSGSGIGLSICKRIVAIHKGEIWCDTNELGGTNFFFTISKDL